MYNIKKYVYFFKRLQLNITSKSDQFCHLHVHINTKLNAIVLSFKHHSILNIESF